MIFRIILTLLIAIGLQAGLAPAGAQTISISNAQIDWKVINRFRLFKNAETFLAHERAWRQYGIHVDKLAASEAEKARLLATTSVIGTEHVLNDRYIPFTRILRRNYEPMGWASHQVDGTCWNPRSREHDACGGVEDYVVPRFHEIELRLLLRKPDTLIAEYNCSWRVADGEPIVAPCDEAVTAFVPYPQGATVSVAVDGEQGISTEVNVRDLLIVGLGDSFASGEGNPDVPVQFSADRRYKNLYPRRARNDGGGEARWLDEVCHRSLYGHQLRAALQIAVENQKTAVTFLGYACSGAAVDEGLLGPQEYVEYVSTANADGGPSQVRAVSGSRKDTQLRWLLRELCAEKPERDGGLWTCPNGAFRRNVDFLFLSVGGNDIGFTELVTWTTLRDNTSSKIAKFLGATVSPKQFAANMKDVLPQSYARLAKAIELAVPLRAEGGVFDPARVVLSAYPDILEDESGTVCAAGDEEGENEAAYAANQSLDIWSSWLVVKKSKLERTHEQLSLLHDRMADLAGDHGWLFAARAYGDRPFRGHGFCARSKAAAGDPAEQLSIPCWSRAGGTCESSWSGKDGVWQPFDPRSENFPYALRQRWVRTFNDAYMTINKKVLDRSGRIDEDGSSAVFSETTGAMHPTAEGHAAMADAILIDLRSAVAATLGEELN
jgi:lysophospholipase L1-like esterase